MHGVEMAKDLSRAVELQVLAGNGGGIIQVHGSRRNASDQRKEHRPSDGEREEDAHRHVPEEAGGAALLEQKRAEEAGDAVEDGHPEDMDESQGHIEQSGRRSVLPGPVAVPGISDRGVEVYPEEHHRAPEGVERVVTARGHRSHGA